jgi:hypothetical protein
MSQSQLEDTLKFDSIFDQQNENKDSKLKPFPKLKSPGKIEKLSHMKELFDINKYLFTGFQLTFHNIIDRHFTVGHTLHLGKEDQQGIPSKDDDDVERGSYALHSQFSTKHMMLHGICGTSGVSQAVFAYNRGGFGTMWHMQVVEDNLGFDVNLSYSLQESCVEAKIQSREVALAYTQAFTPQLSFGAEYSIGLPKSISNKFLLQHKDKIAKTKKTITMTVGTEKFETRLYYSKKFTKNLEFLSAYRLTQKKKEGSSNINSNWYFGYSTKSNRAVIKSLIEGTGSVASLVEIPFSSVSTLVLSGKINYKLNTYDFGFGVNVMM